MVSYGNKNRLLNSVRCKDQAWIWHPYTQALVAPPPIPIVRAEGALLYTDQDDCFIDAISSWWVNLHGHRHPYIVNRIQQQLNALEHVMFGDFTHAPAVDLAEKLLSLLPPSFQRLFFSDNGSTAVETALKIALQYWHNRDCQTGRKKIVALKGGYHGDTFGAMSVSERGLFTQPFASHLFDIIFIDPPSPGQEEISLRQLGRAIEQNEIACFIFEPIVQGVAGMKVHSASGLDALIQLCHENRILTIADEVMTGFGRTGPNFAIEQLQHTPSMICLSKGLTGGFLPLGVTVCEDGIYEEFLSKSRRKALLHGHSYCANPLACAAGIASLELLDTEECVKQRQFIEQQHLAFASTLENHPAISHCQVVGTILNLEYYSQNATGYYNDLRDYLAHFFYDRRILVRPLGNTVHVIPPYCITQLQLQTVYEAIVTVGDQNGA